MINGNGRVLSVNGDYYEGNFNFGKIEGYGIFYSNNDKYKYNGEFKENKFHGKGKIIYEKNNIIYEGEFNDGYKHGFGKITFYDKSYYEGNFEKNIFHGKGKFFFQNGKNYTGEWKNNKMDGEGNFYWENGAKYKGDYKNNMREGNGVYSFGFNLYDGSWVNGIPHGKGTLLYEGLRIVGIFRYGKILEIIEGKGANREMTEKLTIDSKVNLKFDDTFKDTIDSKIISGKESRIIRYSQKDLSSKYSKEKKENLSKSSKSKNDIVIKSSKDKKSKNKDKEKGGKKNKVSNNKDKNKKNKKNLRK